MSDTTATFLLDPAMAGMGKSQHSLNKSIGSGDQFATVLDQQTRQSQATQPPQAKERVSSAAPKPSNQPESKAESQPRPVENASRESEATAQRASSDNDTQDSAESSDEQAKEHGRGPEQAARRLQEKTDDDAESKVPAHAASAEKGQETSTAKHQDILSMLMAKVQEKHPEIDLSEIDEEALLAQLEGEGGEELLEDLEAAVEELVATATEDAQPKTEEVTLVQPVVSEDTTERKPETEKLEPEVTNEALLASLAPQQVVEEEVKQEAVTGRDVAKAATLNPLASAVRQNVEKQVKQEPLPLEVETEEAISEDLLVSETALEKVLERLELRNGKMETVLAAREAQSRAGSAAEFLEQLTSRLAAESGTDNRSLVGALNAANQTNSLRPGGPVAQQVLSTPLNSPDWSSAFAKRISFFVRNDMQNAELRLDPPEMGRVNIRINISQDQANLQITAQHANVRDAIEQSLPRLREMLAESGLNLGNADVSTQLANQQKQQQGEGGGQLAGPAFPGMSEGEGDEAGAAPTKVIESDSLVDFYA